MEYRKRLVARNELQVLSPVKFTACSFSHSGFSCLSFIDTALFLFFQLTFLFFKDKKKWAGAHCFFDHVWK